MAGELAVGLCARGGGDHGAWATTEQHFKGGGARGDQAAGGRCRAGEATGRTTGRAGGVPVIGNTRTAADVVGMLGETGAGVMIGRGAFAMPWVPALGWSMQVGARGRGKRPIMRSGSSIADVRCA
ncbi:MAG: hypothetical protein R3B49_04175 [Phycisphaerales bacterium]